MRSRLYVASRSGHYRLDHLITRYGIDATLFARCDEITADCPRKHSAYIELDDRDGWKLRLAKELRAAGLKIDMHGAL